MFAILTRMFAVLSLILSLAQVASAEKYQAVALSEDQVRAVDKISKFMNSFQSLRGDFVQTSARGQKARGIVLISKPGKMRFEYEPPNPLVVIADGRWLTIKNKVKERGDQYPLSSTPLRLVVSPKVDLMKETVIVGFDSKDGLTSVAFQDKKTSVGGYLVLVFDEQANMLQQWIVVDGKGRKTTVELANVEFGGKFDPKLFVGKIDREKSKK
jgi:outer membrane lipoprotein-sorting protein